MPKYTVVWAETHTFSKIVEAASAGAAIAKCNDEGHIEPPDTVATVDIWAEPLTEQPTND